jgi:hypothetical protein
MFAAARVGLRSAAPVARRNASTQAGANVKKTCVQSLASDCIACAPQELTLTPHPCCHSPTSPIPLGTPISLSFACRSPAGSGRRGTSRPPSPSLPLSAPVSRPPSSPIPAPPRSPAGVPSSASSHPGTPLILKRERRDRRGPLFSQTASTRSLLLTRTRIVPPPSPQPASVRVGT